MALITRKAETKVSHVTRLWKELFLSRGSIVRKTKYQIEELSKTTADAILTKLHDEKKKEPNKYLSSLGLECSWKYCSEERKAALLGITSTETR